MGDLSYVTIEGRRYCSCTVAVLEMAEAGFKAAGIIPASKSIHDYITQGGYRAGATAASKGSHDLGGVIDTWFSLVNTDAKQRIWDAAGAVGCRRHSWEFTSTKTPDHGHIIVVGCPHLAEFAADQLAEIRRGGDGMAGTRAWVGPKLTFTPWRTRYAAFKAQQEEEDMPTASEVATEVVKQLRNSPSTANGTTAGLAHHWVTTAVDARTALAGIAQVRAEVAALREKVGGESIDMAALASSVVAALLPQVVAAVTAAGGALTDSEVDRIAKATAAEFAEGLAK